MSTTYYQDDSVTLHHGDALEVARTLSDESVNCIVTSPPYFGLRDYGSPMQWGLESSPSLYVARMRRLFSELHRVLADDGTLWLNLGDSYASDPGNGRGAGSTLAGRKHDVSGSPMPTSNTCKPGVAVPRKNLLGIPWRVAFALQDDGWILRNAIVWSKPNAMPESVTDRLSKRYENVFLFSKSSRYWFDLDAVRVEYSGDRTPSRTARTGATNKRNSIATAWNAKAGSRNPGDVWVIPTQPFPEAHFAVMPLALAQHCVMAGCKPGGTVLDPFSGSATTGLAAQRLGRKYIGIDLNREYLDLSLRTRLQAVPLDFEAGA
ncbi:DNA-methyltransferase [Mycobacteroides abscessus]|uniref:DNA-methyltransferase n=1 Tax=Mycobacteroides abscessus TaxID=36809 RepID=UPI000C26AA44|nr:site-specific DNA-methyltransferase [Mycobacteroides abscessus]